MAGAARRVGSVCLVAIGLGACGGGEPKPPRAGCFQGDPASSPALALVYQTPDRTLAPVTEGGPVPLIVPPQGGEVLIIGVRARNIDGCPLTMSTSLALPSGVVAAFERRPVMLAAAPDEWLEPANPTGLANFSNLPACPIAGLDRPIDGESYRLTVDVEDGGGRHAEISATVIPTCDTSGSAPTCRCLCAAGYVLGTPCL